jgi:hypothetical protein
MNPSRKLPRDGLSRVILDGWSQMNPGRLGIPATHQTKITVGRATKGAQTSFVDQKHHCIIILSSN